MLQRNEKPPVYKDLEQERALISPPDASFKAASGTLLPFSIFFVFKEEESYKLVMIPPALGA